MKEKLRRPQRWIFCLFHNLARYLGGWIDDYTVKKKLRTLYIFCMLIPLILTDSVIFSVVLHSDRTSARYEQKDILSSMKYDFSSAVDDAITLANGIYTNQYVNSYLNREYASPLEYFIAYHSFMKNTMLSSVVSASETVVTLYADNHSILNGRQFLRLEKAQRESRWYRQLQASGQDRILYIYFDASVAPTSHSKRKISIIRKLNYYQQDSYEKVLKLDIDYNGLLQDTLQRKYDAPVYVCAKDKILLSNQGYSSVGTDFDPRPQWKNIGTQETFTLYGQEITIYVLQKEGRLMTQLWKNLPLIVFLICLNSLFPWMFVKLLNRSFTRRLQELSGAFRHAEDERLLTVDNVRGKDEIGELMRNYNRIAQRVNELIQTVYKDKLKKQEINMARQNAELLALYSQINPHFLFNALESIRMHSVLRNEHKTAHMVEKLALMEREYVDWRTDTITVGREMEFVRSYLELQKYRFGDRLSYHMEIDESCLPYYIPKLTLVTFVENACVHGIERKATPGWIFVRVFREANFLCLEIEDTGYGIAEPLLSQLREKIEHVDITAIKQEAHIGILNAALRLRMATEDTVCFELESEPGSGIIITIKIPLQKLKQKEELEA